MEDTDSGLPVRQLLKMLANEDIDLATFKQLTKHVVGCDEDVPIELGEDDPPATEAEAPEPETNAAATAPAAAAHVPTAVEGDSDSEDKDDEEEEEAEDDDDDDAEEAAAARAPLPWGEAEAEAEAEEVEEQPPAKKQRTWGDGPLFAFVTKHAPPAAKIAAFSYVLRADHLQDGERLRRLLLLGLA